jgi:cytochrome c peroxidase
MNHRASSLVLIAVSAFACNRSSNESQATAASTAPVEEGFTGVDFLAFKPLPEVMESPKNRVNDAKVALGKMLYFDARLSKNHDVSCNSCHGLDTFGADRRMRSEGHRKQPGARNAPTVYNAAGQFLQFWDGRSEDVEQQALQQVLNPVEMALPNDAAAVSVLASIPGYVEAFAKAFPESPEAVTFENFGRAVGAFERTLVTPSKWDAYLKGDRTALSYEQKQGLRLFIDTGCVACHYGPYVGGTMFKKLGDKETWPGVTDRGRAVVTKNEADEFHFKVPSLRNVAETAPYFHDGTVATLVKAIRLMGKYQLGRVLDDHDAGLIAAWLTSLTGALPEGIGKTPELPPSGPNTPKPDPS